MELKEFVSETLTQIIDGVKIAQTQASETNAVIARDGDYVKVEFDVAITTTDVTEGKVGAGIFVASINLGGQARGEISNQTLSHIMFSIPLYLPYIEKPNSHNW
ncbi:MAG: hypothetical protein WA109_08340 [Bellilinea sp.]